MAVGLARYIDVARDQRSLSHEQSVNQLNPVCCAFDQAQHTARVVR
jgi:hypothetical protein